MWLSILRRASSVLSSVVMKAAALSTRPMSNIGFIGCLRPSTTCGLVGLLLVQGSARCLDVLPHCVLETVQAAVDVGEGDSAAATLLERVPGPSLKLENL